MQYLQLNTTLQGGKYRITRVLGKGGFGITYLAIQSGLERKVAVKEFFMKELCDRDETTSHVTIGTEGSRESVSRFREKFLKEARNIAKLTHPNIVRVIDVFEENGTAYYVMEYADGGSLADKVKREGYLSEPVATRYIICVAKALDYIHQRRMNHLDVKPANIMLNEVDEPVLIDFGLSKQYDTVTGSQTSTTPVGISEGYAPMEQYMQGGVGAFSPETDVYALGATFYYLLTGLTPPNASVVGNDGLSPEPLKEKGVSDKTIGVISKAMEGRKKDRTKSAQAFMEGLAGASASLPAQIPIPASSPSLNASSSSSSDTTILKPGNKQAFENEVQSKAEVSTKGASKFKMSYIAIIAGVVTALVVGFILLMGGKGKAEEGGETVEKVADAKPTVGSLNGHEWIDLGLPSGTKWATTNVGASSPSDYGDYFAWGETSPKSSYSLATYIYNTIPDKYFFSKYVTESDYGNVDGKKLLDKEDDAAHANWGEGWLMPSGDQFYELHGKCKWTETTMNGLSGYKVVGPNGNSIFLPLAGFYAGSYFGQGGTGRYWSRLLSTDYCISAVMNEFYAGKLGNGAGTCTRDCGCSVRPVLAP